MGVALLELGEDVGEVFLRLGGLFGPGLLANWLGTAGGGCNAVAAVRGGSVAGVAVCSLTAFGRIGRGLGVWNGIDAHDVYCSIVPRETRHVWTCAAMSAWMNNLIVRDNPQGLKPTFSFSGLYGTADEPCPDTTMWLEFRQQAGSHVLIRQTSGPAIYSAGVVPQSATLMVRKSSIWRRIRAATGSIEVCRVQNSAC